MSTLNNALVKSHAAHVATARRVNVVDATRNTETPAEREHKFAVLPSEVPATVKDALRFQRARSFRYTAEGREPVAGIVATFVRQNASRPAKTKREQEDATVFATDSGELRYYPQLFTVVMLTVDAKGMYSITYLGHDLKSWREYVKPLSAALTGTPTAMHAMAEGVAKATGLSGSDVLQIVSDEEIVKQHATTLLKPQLTKNDLKEYGRQVGKVPVLALPVGNVAPAPKDDDDGEVIDVDSDGEVVGPNGCHGVTSSGALCKGKAKDNGFCQHHQKQAKAKGK